MTEEPQADDTDILLILDDIMPMLSTPTAGYLYKRCYQEIADLRAENDRLLAKLAADG